MKKVIALFMLFFFIFSAFFVFPLYASAYNGSSAANYAQEWAYSRNPYYLNCDIEAGGGGDCTNFVSQCVRAGELPICGMVIETVISRGGLRMCLVQKLQVKVSLMQQPLYSILVL